MINKLVQILSFIFLGAILGLLGLVTADQMGLFIQKWPPEFALIDRARMPAHQKSEIAVQNHQSSEVENPATAVSSTKVNRQSVPGTYNEITSQL